MLIIFFFTCVYECQFEQTMEWWNEEALVKLESPTSIMICGPTNVGKTWFLKRLLMNASKMFKRPPTHILYCYGSVWQSIFSDMENQISNISFHSGLPNESELMDLANEKSHFICVLDDLMLEAANSQSVERIFTKGSHHLDMTVVFLVQNIFEKGKFFRTISLNTKYFVLFRNTRDKQQVQTFGRQLYPNKVNYFLNAYSQATSYPYGYLLVDLNVNIDSRLELRTRIFPGEDTIVYCKDEEIKKIAESFSTTPINV